MSKKYKATDPFVMLTKRLLCSPSWQAMSINCRRLIDFLMREHLSKAGRLNGELLATYDQLVQAGISRRLVHITISEAERLGLIRVERGGKRGYTNHYNKFMLTFLPTYQDNAKIGAVHDWKETKLEVVKKSKTVLRTETVSMPLTYMRRVQ